MLTRLCAGAARRGGRDARQAGADRAGGARRSGSWASCAACSGNNAELNAGAGIPAGHDVRRRGAAAARHDRRARASSRSSIGCSPSSSRSAPTARRRSGRTSGPPWCRASTSWIASSGRMPRTAAHALAAAGSTGSQVKLDPFYLIAILNMLGACAAMMQEFERGLTFNRPQEAFQRDFSAAGPPPDRQTLPQLAGHLPRGLARAEHRARQRMAGPARSGRDSTGIATSTIWSTTSRVRCRRITCRPSLLRAAAGWPTCCRARSAGPAPHFLQRAHRIRPGRLRDAGTALPHVHAAQAHRRGPQDLRRLREVRPNDPQAELFELEVREVRKLDEVDALLSDLRRIAQRFPNDARVEEPRAALVNNVVPDPGAASPTSTRGRSTRSSIRCGACRATRSTGRRCATSCATWRTSTCSCAASPRSAWRT